MANMTTSLRTKVVNGVLGVQAYTFPTEVFLALFSADPTTVGLVTDELSGDGYARMSLSGKFTLSSTGVSSNTAAIQFPQATADWPLVLYAGIMESITPTTADMLIVVPLEGAVPTASGEDFIYEIGKFTVEGL